MLQSDNEFGRPVRTQRWQSNVAWLKFERTLALRFLREGKTQSILTIGGTTLGVGLIVFITAMLAGLQADITRRILGSQAHVIVRPPDEVNATQLIAPPSGVRLENLQARAQRLRPVNQWQTLLAQVRTLPGVTAATPVVSGAGNAVRGEADKAVTLIGVEAEEYRFVSGLDKKLTAGQWRLQADDAVIGIELAKDFGVQIGDRIRVQTLRGGAQALIVRGLFDLGNRELNRRNVYINFRTGQSMLSLPGGASSVEISIRDIFSAQEYAEHVKQFTHEKVESWIEINKQLFVGLANQNFVTRTIRVFVAILVAVGITSVLVVVVVQKQKEIGILRAIGAGSGQVSRVFLVQGAIIGALGGTAGIFMGSLLTFVASRVMRSLDGGRIFEWSFDYKLYFSAIAIAFIFGILAAVIPANRASRLDPAQAIRT